MIKPYPAQNGPYIKISIENDEIAGYSVIEVNNKKQEEDMQKKLKLLGIDKKYEGSEIRGWYRGLSETSKKSFLDIVKKDL